MSRTRYEPFEIIRSPHVHEGCRPWKVWLKTGVVGRAFIGAFKTEEAARKAVERLNTPTEV